MAANDVSSLPLDSAGELHQDATSATTDIPTTDAPTTDSAAQCSHLLALVQDMRAARDSLGERPTLHDVDNAANEIVAIDKHLVSQMEALVSETRPDGADEFLFKQLVALKQDVMRTAASMKKRKPQATLDLEAKYRHYDKMVMLAEEAVLTGRLPTLVASAETEPVVVEPCAEPAEVENFSGVSVGEETGGLNAAEAVSTATDGGNGGDASTAAAATAVATTAVVAAAAGAATAVSTPVAEAAAAKPVCVTSASPDSTLASPVTESPAAVVGSPPPARRAVRSLSPPPGPSARAVSFGRDVAGAAVTRKDASGGGKDGKEPNTKSVSKFATMPQASQLKPIEEASAGLEIDPKLLTVLEEAAQERRQELDLQGHHFKSPLAYLPESVGLLDWIVELRLANNGLVVLPQAIGNLFCLSVLDTSCNKLVEVPESIGHLAKLRVLDLHHNYLEELPTSIGHCEALEELRLGFNSLTGLPEAICKLAGLKLLSAPLNQLTYVPRRIGNLEKLTDLDVHYNSLQSIPESIGRLERLTSLNISANHYHLKELPETLGNLRSLVKLDISENYIKILPISFVNLTSLKKLSLQGNPWQHPPMDVANSGLQGVMDYLNLHDIVEDSHGGPKKLGGLLGFFRQKQKEDPKLAAWKKNTRTL